MRKIQQRIHKHDQSRSQSEDDFIKAYFKKSIIPMWPENWMKYKEIQTECFNNVAGETKENKKRLKNIQNQQTLSTAVSREQKPSSESVVTTHNNNIVKGKTNELKEPKPKKLCTENGQKKLNEIKSNFDQFDPSLFIGTSADERSSRILLPMPKVNKNKKRIRFFQIICLK